MKARARQLLHWGLGVALAASGVGVAVPTAATAADAAHFAAAQRLTHSTSARAARPEVGVGRWRKLHVGMTVRSAVATGMVTRHAEICDSVGLKPRWAKRGWASFYPRPKLAMVAIWSPKERAKGGVGVGSTLDEVRDAYPGLSEIRYREVEGYDLPYAYVRTGHRTLTFQLGTDTTPRGDSPVRTMVLGRKHPQVLWEAC